MLTIKYKEENQAVDNWKLELETLVMAHELIQDETIDRPILTTKSETIIGEKNISEYVEELTKFKSAWYCGVIVVLESKL